MRESLFLMQGQCKPNAESSLYAEVQPVLAFRRQSYDENPLIANISALFLQLVATIAPIGDKSGKYLQNLSCQIDLFYLFLKIFLKYLDCMVFFLIFA